MGSGRSRTPLDDFAAMSCVQRRGLVVRYAEAFASMASSLPAIDRDDLKPLLVEVAKELTEMIDELAEGKSGGEVMVRASYLFVAMERVMDRIPTPLTVH
jgi:hypothetical protein